MKFTHVSMDLPTDFKEEFLINEKEFTPRIPIYRCKEEDSTINRVCVCNSLEGAVGAFPYKGLFVNERMQSGREEHYLALYEVNANEVNYMTDLELKELVPDSHLTKEHWVLSSFKSKPKLIKIKSIKLSNYNKYTCEYTGFVKDMSYENAIEDFNRECEYTFAWKKYLKEAIKFAEDNNIRYEIIDSGYKHIHYNRYTWSDNKYNGTTKTYNLVKVKFHIPKNLDISKLWLINHSQQEFAIKKNLRIKPFLATSEDLEDIQYCYEEGLLY